MTTSTAPAPAARPHTTTVVVERDREGDRYVDTAAGRITVGSDSEGHDEVTLDVDTVMSLPAFATLLAAGRALLDQADPHHVARVAPGPAPAPVDDHDHARQIADRHTVNQLHAGVRYLTKWDMNGPLVGIWRAALAMAEQRRCDMPVGDHDVCDQPLDHPDDDECRACRTGGGCGADCVRCGGQGCEVAAA